MDRSESAAPGYDDVLAEAQKAAMHPGRVMAEPRPQDGQVNGELNRLGAEIDQLHGAITGLEGALVPLCTEESSDVKEAEPREVLVPLASRLRVCHDAVNDATTRLHRLYARLEL